MTLTRRSFLRAGAISGSALLAGLDAFARPTLALQHDPFATGQQIGVAKFVHEGPAPLEVPLGAELDGRLFTDLSKLSQQSLVTPTEKFYVRTRASQLLPDTAAWRVRVE